MKIKKIWTGNDHKTKKPITVYYMDEDDISVRKFGKPDPELTEGMKVDVEMNEKGFFDFADEKPKSEAKPAASFNGSVQASIIRMSALKSAVDYCKGNENMEVIAWAERFEEWLLRN